MRMWEVLGGPKISTAYRTILKILVTRWTIELLTF